MNQPKQYIVVAREPILGKADLAADLGGVVASVACATAALIQPFSRENLSIGIVLLFIACVLLLVRPKSFEPHQEEAFVVKLISVALSVIFIGAIAGSLIHDNPLLFSEKLMLCSVASVLIPMLVYKMVSYRNINWRR